MGANETRWLVPTRYWEDLTPIKCEMVEDLSAQDDGPEAWNVRAFHHDYGHVVYLRKSDLFETPEEAIAEGNKRAAAKKIKEDAEFEEWYKKWKAEFFPWLDNQKEIA